MDYPRLTELIPPVPQRHHLPVVSRQPCAVSGCLLQVNPFDQPGVEADKKYMFRLLGKE